MTSLICGNKTNEPKLKERERGAEGGREERQTNKKQTLDSREQTGGSQRGGEVGWVQEAKGIPERTCVMSTACCVEVSSHSLVHLKLTQHCMLTELEIKLKKLKQSSKQETPETFPGCGQRIYETEKKGQKDTMLLGLKVEERGHNTRNMRLQEA